jgi:hypothetical protein
MKFSAEEIAAVALVARKKVAERPGFTFQNQQPHQPLKNAF